jgi:hypothetical protein
MWQWHWSQNDPTIAKKSILREKLAQQAQVVATVPQQVAPTQSKFATTPTTINYKSKTGLENLNVESEKMKMNQIINDKKLVPTPVHGGILTLIESTQ